MDKLENSRDSSAKAIRDGHSIDSSLKTLRVSHITSETWIRNLEESGLCELEVIDRERSPPFPSA